MDRHVCGELLKTVTAGDAELLLEPLSELLGREGSRRNDFINDTNSGCFKALQKLKGFK